MHAYLAIDGGGTKTSYCLLDEQGAVMDRLTAGRTNHESFPHGFDDMENALKEAILPLLARNGLHVEEVCDTVAGMAGADHEQQITEIQKRLNHIGLRQALVMNDGFLAVKGGTDSGFGIAYNCGTGVCCDGIHPSGKMVQAGGLGTWSGDCSGGLDIAANVYRMIYDHLFLALRPTCLTEAYMNHFGLIDAQAFYDSITRLTEDAAALRDTVQLFFSAIHQGDEVALAYMHQMAQRGTELIQGVYHRLGFVSEQTQVVLSGSIHTKANSDLYVQELKRQLEHLLPGRFHILISDQPPILGAVRWLRERNGLAGK